MRVAIFGHHKKEIEEEIKSLGFELVEENPEVVISYGGDGTLILSEFHFPSVPKLLLKSSKVCKLCEVFSNEEILQRFKNGKYTTKKLTKLEVSAHGKTLYAINDVIIHNENPRHAIRYHVDISGERNPKHEIIGDGLIVSTKFCSTGYYKSITGSIFNVGIGLAFNNSTEQVSHMVINEESMIKISITRGPVTVYADNQEDSFELKEGDEVVIKKSEKETEIVRVDLL